MQPVRIKLPEKIGQIFQGKATYRGAYGGRGAAKTIGFANMAISDIMRLTDQGPWNFLCGRELQKSLQDSVFSVIASQIDKLDVQDAFEVGQKYIRCKNGNEFLFYGLRSNIAEVKGLHRVRRTWLEEAQSVSQPSLTYLLPTVLRDFSDCELWASWNPDDEEDPIHEMFVTNADESIKCVKVNYYDNPWFPESLDKLRLRDLKNKPHQYDWIWEGSFNLNSEAAVYAKWIDASRFVNGLYDPNLAVFTVWDVGFSDDTAIWFFQVVGNEVRCVDYYENSREDVKHYCEQLYGREIVVDEYGPNGKIVRFSLGKEIPGAEHRAAYKYGSHYVPTDASHKLLAAGGRSIVDQMFDVNIKAKVVHPTSQQNQIEAARLSLGFTWFDPERCKQGLRSLRKYQFKYNENKSSYSKEPDHDLGGYSHAADAYEMIAQVWKSAKVEAKAERPKFFEQMTAKEIFKLDDFDDEGSGVI